MREAEPKHVCSIQRIPAKPLTYTGDRRVIFNFFQSLMTLGKCRKRRRRRWSVVLTTKRPEEERVLLKGMHSNLAVRRTLAITASQRW